MTKIAVAHQPDFMPYLGFFHRLLKADIFIIMDNVQFVKSPNGMTHRDLIKTPQGKSWITLSVEKAPQKTIICDINLSKNTDWENKSLKKIEQNYVGARYFNEIHPYVEEMYSHSYSKLIDINMYSINMLMKIFNINIHSVLLSSLKTSGAKNELLISALKGVGASTYLSGLGAKSYLDTNKFSESGISVVWQHYSPITYPQQFEGFTPNLSSIDLLYNCGIEKSRELLINSL